MVYCNQFQFLQLLNRLNTCCPWGAMQLPLRWLPTAGRGGATRGTTNLRYFETGLNITMTIRHLFEAFYLRACWTHGTAWPNWVCDDILRGWRLNHSPSHSGFQSSMRFGSQRSMGSIPARPVMMGILHWKMVATLPAKWRRNLGSGKKEMPNGRIPMNF